MEGDKKIVKGKKVLVVKELPKQDVRSFTEDGVEYDVITTEEALTRILNS